MTTTAATDVLAPYVEARRARLRDALRERDLDALLTFSPANRRYLTGFTGSFGYALVTRDDALFLTDWRYVEQAGTEVPFADVVELPKDKHLWTPLATRLAEADVTRLAYEEDHVTAAWLRDAREDVPGVEWVPVRRLVEGLRARKDGYEIERLRRAQRITDDVFEALLPRIEPGTSERALAVELRHRIELAGAENYPGLPIVASGPRAALPHGRASERRIERGDFVLFDFGALVDGYHSDMTRTVVCGRADARQREVYALVLEAERAGVALARAGTPGREIDRACRAPIRRGGYEAYEHGFSVGHGLGLEVHEDPFLSEAMDAPLEPGAAITIEPGIYVPGWTGVRIEDTVVVGEDGAEELDVSPRELIEL